MDPQSVEVLSDAVNRAVVRMPGRQFPGIVVQGDRLVSLIGAARDIAERAKALGDTELSRLAGNLLADLMELRAAYSYACNTPHAEAKRAEVEPGRAGDGGRDLGSS